MGPVSTQEGTQKGTNTTIRDKTNVRFVDAFSSAGAAAASSSSSPPSSISDAARFLLLEAVALAAAFFAAAFTGAATLQPGSNTCQRYTVTRRSKF